MPHHPKPFFKQQRNTWYVEIERKQIKLGAHADGLPPPNKRKGRWQPPREILDAYHQLMARPKPERKRPAVAHESVLAIIDKFLDWCRENRAEETFECYQWRLQRFAETIDKSLTVSSLKPYHLDEFLHKDRRINKCRRIWPVMVMSLRGEFINNGR